MSHGAAALLTILTLTAMQSRQIITHGPAPVGPYSPAVKAGDFIYVAGTLAQDAAGALVGPGDVAAQTRRVIERTREVLEAAGTSLDRVVSVSVYLKSASDFAAMNAAYRSYWPSEPPTRTTVIADFVVPGALVEMSMIAVAPGAERTVIHPESWLRAPNPYSYGIKSGDTVFLSGLVSRNGRDNTVVAGDAATQTKVVLDNAGELLKAAGLSYEHVVSSRVYLPDASDFAAMNAAYRQYFPAAPPARATVQAALAGRDYSVEITLVASSAKKEVISDGRPPNPNLSAAVRAGSRVYLSGILGNTPETRGDVAAQTRETFARIRALLSAAGLEPADVVDGVVYLTDVDAFAAMNGPYREFFARDFPARTTVRTGLMAADGLVEIMLVASERAR